MILIKPGFSKFKQELAAEFSGDRNWLAATTSGCSYFLAEMLH
jgi:hypothetical protein